MGKTKVSMKGYDSSRAAGVYRGGEPKRGIYDGKMIAVKDHTSGAGNEGFEWQFEITKGEFKGWRGYQYSGMENTLWKTQQIMHAITGSEKDATIDTDDNGAKMVRKAKPVLLRVVQEKYEGENRAKIGSVLPLLDEEDDADEDDEDNEDEEDNAKDPFA